MATITSIQILNRIGEPGAPSFLSPGELAYNQPATTAPVEPIDALYVGNGTAVSLLVGSGRQLELFGAQTIVPGSTKTIDVGDLKLIGGQANWLLQTDGNGNLSFTNAPGGGLTEVAHDGSLAGLGTVADPLAVVPHTVAVATDGVTIEGNGTTASPLMVQGHTVSVAVDGTTINGDGTAANPLHVDPDAITVTTDATLTGNGTTASPLHVVAPLTNATLTGTGQAGSPLGVVADTVAVLADGTTITGNGTTGSPLTAMNGTVAVAVDGVTIGGQGITVSPLHVLPNSVTIATTAPITGNGTTASPIGLNTPLALQYGGTGVNASSNATLLTSLGAASISSLANYVPLSGGAMSGLLTLSGNATANLGAVTLQQMNAAIAAIPAGVSSFNTRTGAITLVTADVTGAGGAPIASPTFTGTVTLPGNAASALQAVPLQQLTSVTAGYLPLSGGTLTGGLTGTNATFTGTSTLGGSTTINNTGISTNNVATGNLGATNVTATTLNGTSGQAITVNQPLNFAASVGGNAINTGTAGIYCGGAFGCNSTSTFQSTMTVNGSITQNNGSHTITAGNLNLQPSGGSWGTLVIFDTNGSSFNATLSSTGGIVTLSTSSVYRLFFCDGIGNNIQTNGNAYKPGGGSWSDNSDARIKTIQGAYTRGIGSIIQLQPQEAVYIGNDTPDPPASGESAPYRESGHYYVAQNGTVFTTFIAQDVESVFPEMVSRRQGYIAGELVSDLRAVDTTPLIYAMVNAFKQIAARLAVLEQAANITPPAADVA